MLGHLDFATALLNHKPDVVTDLDSRGLSPLHIASSNGYVEIEKKLLLVNSGVCLVRDEDGRTPLHLAVMKGRVDVINELVQARPEAVQYKLERGETLLHSCVQHNRLGLLKLLLEQGRVDDLINVQDDNGNTILHLATSLKQMETIKYLLNRSGIGVNAVNGNGFTALDIIEHMPRDLKVMEIRESLSTAGVLRTRMLNKTPSNSSTSDVPHTTRVARPPSRKNSNIKKLVKKNEDWLNKSSDSLMIAATVIASMAYQAGLNPPGGVWQEDVKDPKNSDHTLYYAGSSIIASRSPYSYSIFWVFNTLAFVTSLCTILLLVSGLPVKRRIIIWILMVAMWVTLSSMSITYLYSMTHTSRQATRGDNYIVNYGRYVEFIWVGLIGLVLLGHAVRFLIWSGRKVQKIIKKRYSTYESEGQGQGNV